jgi:NTP pyrophosphatase (non-canonical NTP hydrolase)
MSLDDYRIASEQFDLDQLVKNSQSRFYPETKELNDIPIGYHMVHIEKGIFGEPSKIFEEIEEFKDALTQNNPLMAMQELSDALGAIEAYANKYNMSLDDLIVMKDATKRAFESGKRK